MEASDVKRLKELEEENRRLKQMYADLRLKSQLQAKRRLPARAPEPLTVPNSLGHIWSMDFMSDKLHNNIRFRTFNVIEDYNCKYPKLKTTSK